jgi:ABC-type antimicrobial peptide transport system permease subunit
MINSIKQLFRTPFKVILFFLLAAMGTALLVLGIHLWSDTTRKLNAMEDAFTTIATVTQKEDSMETYSLWDAALQMYSHSDYPVYNRIIPESVLQFEGANYLKDPKKRPYYGAYMPDYKELPEKTGLSDRFLIIEFSPVEDCIPDQPVLVNIVKVLSGETYGSDQLWYCDHFTENPAPLYAGKTYISSISIFENTHTEAQIGTQIEFAPLGTTISSSQFDKTGVKLESELNLREQVSCEEVTEDFYQTGRGRYWLNYIETLRQADETIPVLPTESLELLPAYHAGEAVIVDGREITEDEFQNGEAVCLITTEFAQSNNLNVGDVISLPLYFANYSTDPSYLFGYRWGGLDFSLLNAKGELYPVFWEAGYEIVGIYRYSGGQAGGLLGRTEMARDMVIIPSKSVRASDENNIVDFGPMLDTTTSFQIPNGTIAEFEAAFTKAVPESSLLEITYDDNGYEQISGDLKSARNIAVLLGAIGLFSTLAILMLLLYFFVVKQKKRTAIERSLGLSKRQCRISIISGIMFLTVLATTAGSIGSSVLIEQMPTIEVTNQTGYSTKYSSWALEEVNSELIDKIDTDTPDTSWYINFAVPAMLFFFMLISSIILVNRNLGIEPILLLSTKGD